jgi:hypothetical protein
MIALVLEVYGAFCLFSLIAFLVWAAVATLRPDLDEDLEELEKLKKLASCEQSDFDPQVGDLTYEDRSAPALRRPVKRRRRRLFESHRPLFQTGKHRPT